MKLLQAIVRKRRKNESYLRYTFSQLHLWSALLSGLAIIIISFTGALYVFANEYDNIENRHLIKTDAPSDVLPSIDVLVDDFTIKFDQAPGGIFIPVDKQKNITVANRGFGYDRRKVFVDRATSDIVGTATNNSKAFTDATIRLHRWFMMDDMARGRKLVGYTTFIFMFLLISGLVIWSPRSFKVAKNSFKVKLRGKFKVVNRQLHVNMGFYLTLLLLVITISGVCFTFPGMRQLVVKAFMPDEAQKIEKTMSREQHQAVRKAYYDNVLSFDKMLTISEEVLGYESDVNVYFPSHHFKEYSVIAVNPDNFMGGAWADIVTFDLKGNYKTTYFFKDIALHQQINQLMRPIHTGEIFGLKSKILYLILALFGAFLPISGVIIWWKRIVRKS